MKTPIKVGIAALVLPLLAAAQTIDPVAEVQATRAALLSGDDTGAANHARQVLLYSASLQTGSRHPVPYYPAASESEASIGARFLAAVSAGDMVTAKTLGLVYPLTVGREISAAHPPSALGAGLISLEARAASATGVDRFLLLPLLSAEAYAVADRRKAAAYGNELLSAAARNPSWPQGEATYHANMVLGRIAMDAGDMPLAASSLLAAGKTVGSPSLRTFGPGMALANQLLAAGDKTTVVEYLKECQQFWADDNGRLAEWISQASKGIPPAFGANLKW